MNADSLFPDEEEVSTHQAHLRSIKRLRPCERKNYRPWVRRLYTTRMEAVWNKDAPEPKDEAYHSMSHPP